MSAFARLNRNPTADSVDGAIERRRDDPGALERRLFLGPSYEERFDPMQYVDVVDDRRQPHFVFASIRQVTASLTVRLELDVLAAPVAAGVRAAVHRDRPLQRVQGRRQPARPRRSPTASTRWPATSGACPTTSCSCTGPTDPYAFDSPDFDLRQLRSTVVLRWEYRPGSTVFAIWSHGRSSSEDEGLFRPGYDLRQLYDTPGENIVMVKVNYWVGL